MNDKPAKKNVLLVEDASAMQILVQSLIGTICNLKSVSTLNAAEIELNANDFDLLLLDVGLPDGNGFEFCQKLRAGEHNQDLPIMFLTGKDDVQDKVKGFSLGADDYVVKPPEPNEFIARVKAKLARTHAIKNSTKFVKGPFKLDLISQKAYLSEKDIETDLELTPIEFKLFAIFLKNEGKPHPRADLKKSVWGPSIHLSDHTVDTHVSSLRKKLTIYGAGLKSVVRTGYVFLLNQFGKD